MRYVDDLFYKCICVHAKLTALVGRDWVRVTVSGMRVLGRGEVQLQHKLIDHDHDTTGRQLPGCLWLHCWH